MWEDRIEITNESNQPIIFPKKGIKPNGINATLSQSMTADKGIAKIFASKKGAEAIRVISQTECFILSK